MLNYHKSWRQNCQIPRFCRQTHGFESNLTISHSLTKLTLCSLTLHLLRNNPNNPNWNTNREVQYHLLQVACHLFDTNLKSKFLGWSSFICIVSCSQENSIFRYLWSTCCAKENIWFYRIYYSTPILHKNIIIAHAYLLKEGFWRYHDDENNGDSDGEKFNVRTCHIDAAWLNDIGDDYYDLDDEDSNDRKL